MGHNITIDGYIEITLGFDNYDINGRYPDLIQIYRDRKINKILN
jgi:hypothetical protein